MQIRIRANTPGHNQGKILPNFNDGYEGSAPDMGAVEKGSGGFCFGHECGKGLLGLFN